MNSIQGEEFERMNTSLPYRCFFLSGAFWKQYSAHAWYGIEVNWHSGFTHISSGRSILLSSLDFLAAEIVLLRLWIIENFEKKKQADGLRSSGWSLSESLLKQYSIYESEIFSLLEFTSLCGMEATSFSSFAFIITEIMYWIWCRCQIWYVIYDKNFGCSIQHNFFIFMMHFYVHRDNY